MSSDAILNLLFHGSELIWNANIPYSRVLRHARGRAIHRTAAASKAAGAAATAAAGSRDGGQVKAP